MKSSLILCVLLLAVACQARNRDCTCGLGSGTNPCTCGEVVVKAAKLPKPFHYASPQAINEAAAARAAAERYAVADTTVTTYSNVQPGAIGSYGISGTSGGSVSVSGSSSSSGSACGNSLYGTFGRGGLAPGAESATAATSGVTYGSNGYVYGQRKLGTSTEVRDLLSTNPNAKVAPSFPPIGDLCYPSQTTATRTSTTQTTTKVIPAIPVKPNCCCRPGSQPDGISGAYVNDAGATTYISTNTAAGSFGSSNVQTYSAYSQLGGFGAGSNGVSGGSAGSYVSGSGAPLQIYGGGSSGSMGSYGVVSGGSMGSYGGVSGGSMGSYGGVSGGSMGSYGVVSGGSMGSYGGVSGGSMGSYGGGLGGIVGGLTDGSAISGGAVRGLTASGIGGAGGVMGVYNNGATAGQGGFGNSDVAAAVAGSAPNSQYFDNGGCGDDTPDNDSVPLSQIPADAVSLTLAYKNLAAPVFSLPKGKKYVPEDRISFGPRTIPADGQVEKKKADVPEEKLQTVQKPVVELQPVAPRKPAPVEEEEENPAEIEAMEQEKSVDQPEQPSSFITYGDLGYAPVKMQFAPRMFIARQQQAVARATTVTEQVGGCSSASGGPCGPLGPPVSGYVPGAVIVQQNTVQSPEEQPAQDAYPSYNAGNDAGDDVSDEEEEEGGQGVARGLLARLRSSVQRVGCGCS